jgi:hypothetical protein
MEKNFGVILVGGNIHPEQNLQPITKHILYAPLKIVIGDSEPKSVWTSISSRTMKTHLPAPLKAVTGDSNAKSF